jgi:hypothetical protein
LNQGRQRSGPLRDGKLLRQQAVDEVVLAGNHRTQTGLQLRDQRVVHAVDIGAVRLPVFVVADIDRAVLVAPLDEFHHAGADGIAVEIVAELLGGGRRDHHARAIRQDQRQRRVRLFQMQRDLVGRGHLDTVDGGDVGTDVRARMRQAAVEVELHRLGIERRAIVEGDA